MSRILAGLLLVVLPEVGKGEDLARLHARAAQQGSVSVIVGIDAATQPQGYVGGGAAVADQRARIRQAQRSVLASVPAASYRLTRQFETIPFVALDVTAAGLDALATQPGVTSVTEDILLDPALADSVPLIGGDVAWGDGLTGAGQTIAILDTGVESTHPFLSGKVVAEACYSNKSDCPNGATSQIGPGSAVPCKDTLTCNHGTHVAGIAAGSGPDFAGVARDAAIIAIQVFSRRTGSECAGTGGDPCYRASTSDVVAALEHIYAVRTSYTIAAANLSLSAGKYTSQASCDRESGAYKAIIDTLRSAGIATVAAAGNDFYTDGLGQPACVSSAVSVGASTKADTIWGFSNSAPFLSLLAPGQDIKSAALGGGFRLSDGTSMAAPHVAGAWAVLKQASPGASVDSILNLLKATGAPITDPRNGVTTPRIDLDAALQALPGDCTTESVGAGAAQLPAPVTAPQDVGIDVVSRPLWQREPTSEAADVRKRETDATSGGAAAALDVVVERSYLRTAQDAGEELPIPTIGQYVYFHADWHVDGTGGPVRISARAVLDGTTSCALSFDVSGGESGVIFCNASWRVTAGTHTLRWDFDYDRHVSESNENNNSASTTWTSSNGFDFLAQRAFLKTGRNAGVEVATPGPGQTVFFHLDVQVVGPDRQTTISVRASLDGVQFCTGSVDKGPGLYTIGCTQGWTATTGTHTLRWDVDHTGAVPETNESNNSVSTTWSSGAIDLEAQRAYWRTASVSAGGEIVTPEPSQRAYAHVDWRVTGSGGTVAVRQRALLDGALLCSCEHTATAGAAYTSSCNRNWRVLPGAHTLRWELDYDNAVGESNEDNNAAVTNATTAAARVDLVAERAYLRTAANGGDEVTTATQEQRVFAHLTWSVSGATEPVTVRLRAWADGYEWCHTTSTTASGRITHWCTLGLKFNPAIHTLQWDLDFLDDVPETNESNNSASMEFITTSLTPSATLPPTHTRTRSPTSTRTPTFATPTRTRTPSRTATVLTPTITRTPSRTATFPTSTPTATPTPTERGLYPRGDADCSVDLSAADLLAAARAATGASICANDDCNRDGRVTISDIDCTAGCMFGECPPPPSAPRATAVHPVTAPAIWPFSVARVDVANLGSADHFDRVTFNGIEAEVIGREGANALRVIVPDMEPGPADVVVLAGDVAGPALRIVVSAAQTIGVVDNTAATLDLLDQSAAQVLALNLEAVIDGAANASQGVGAANIIGLISLMREQIQTYQSAVRRFGALLRDPQNAGWAALDRAIEGSGVPERLKALLPDLVSTAISERDKLRRAAEVYQDVSRVLDAAGQLKRTLDPLVAQTLDAARAELARVGSILADEMKMIGDQAQEKLGMVLKVSFTDAAGNERKYPTAGGKVRVLHARFGLLEHDELIVHVASGILQLDPEDSGDGFYDYRLPDAVGICGPILLSYSNLSGVLGLSGLRTSMQPELLALPRESAKSHEPIVLRLRGVLGCSGKARFTRQVSDPLPAGVHPIEELVGLAPAAEYRARAIVPVVPPDRYDVAVQVDNVASEERFELQVLTGATGLTVFCSRTQIELSSDPSNPQSILCTAIPQPNLSDVPSAPGSGFVYVWNANSQVVELQQDDRELGLVKVVAKRLGTAQVTVEAHTDTDTFVAQSVAPVTITVADTTAPTLSLSTVETALRPGGFIKIKARAGDNNEVSQITLRASGDALLDPVQEWVCLPPFPPGPRRSCEHTFTLNLKAAAFFTDGHIHVQAEALDVAANRTLAKALEFFVAPLATATPAPTATPTEVPNAAVYAYIGVGPALKLVDTASDEVVDTIALGGRRDVLDIEITADGRMAYLLRFGEELGVNARVITIVDLAAKAVIDTIPVCANGRELALRRDDAFLYIACFAEDRLDVFRTSTRQVERSIPLGDLSRPDFVVTSPVANLAFVNLGNQIAIVDTTSHEVVDRTTPGGGSRAIAVSPDGELFYAARTEGVDVFETDTGDFANRIDPFPPAEAPSTAVDIVTARHGEKVYASYYRPGTVTIGQVVAIDTRVDEVVKKFVFEQRAYRLAVTPDGNKLYVTPNTRGAVQVISTVTDLVVATIDLPVATAIDIAPAP